MYNFIVATLVITLGDGVAEVAADTPIAMSMSMSKIIRGAFAQNTLIGGPAGAR